MLLVHLGFVNVQACCCTRWPPLTCGTLGAGVPGTSRCSSGYGYEFHFYVLVFDKEQHVTLHSIGGIRSAVSRLYTPLSIENSILTLHTGGICCVDHYGIGAILLVPAHGHPVVRGVAAAGCQRGMT